MKFRCTLPFLLTMLALPSLLPAQALSPAFDTVAIKPAKPDAHGRGWDNDNNTTTIENFSVLDLILRAYFLKARAQVLDAPEWAKGMHFDIRAKLDAEEYKKLNALSPDGADVEFRTILQNMLAERFGLKVERSTRRMPMLRLERVSAGALPPALTKTPEGPDGRPIGGSNFNQHNGHLEVSGGSMESVAATLSGRYEVGQRVVQDHTGLPGYYNFTVDFSPDNGNGVSPEATLPGMEDAFREQLGLKLVKQDDDVPVLIVKALKQPEMD